MAEKFPVIVFLFRTLVGEFLLLGRGDFLLQVENNFSLPGKNYVPVGEKMKTKSGKWIIENGGKSYLYLRFK